VIVVCFCAHEYDGDLLYCPNCLVPTPSGRPEDEPEATYLFRHTLLDIESLPEA
jgi:hypothetical protein